MQFTAPCVKIQHLTFPVFLHVQHPAAAETPINLGVSMPRYYSHYTQNLILLVGCTCLRHHDLP